MLGAVKWVMWRDLDAGPAGEEVPWSERIAALKSVGKYPSVALFVLVIGGIYLGVFTPPSMIRDCITYILLKKEENFFLS